MREPASSPYDSTERFTKMINDSDQEMAEWVHILRPGPKQERRK